MFSLKTMTILFWVIVTFNGVYLGLALRTPEDWKRWLLWALWCFNVGMMGRALTLAREMAR